MKRIIFSLVTLALLAGTGVSQAEDKPIAKIGDTVLTEEQAKKELATSLFEAETKIYDTKRAWIDRKAQEILFNQAAQKAKMTRQEWESREIDGKIQPPTDKEINDFVQRYPAGRGPTPQQASQFLFAQKRSDRAKTVYNELAKQTGMQVLLPEPIVPVLYGESDPQHGPANAPVTIVEFTDYECPYCRKSQDSLSQVEKTYGKKVKLVARQYPLSFHARAKPAAEASLCAKEQGKFWEYRAKLFRQLTLADHKKKAKELGLNTGKFNKCLDSQRYAVTTDTDVANVPLYGGHAPQAILCAKEQGKMDAYRAWVMDPGLQDSDFKQYAKDLKLNEGQFDQCYASHKYSSKVDSDMMEGQQLGVNGTPHFFINGRSLNGAQPFASFQNVIEAELAKQKK
jgi:protein-disulfide isomerase